MVPDLQCALICEDVRLEVAGGTTLVGVVNTILTPQIPVRLLKLCVFTRWCSGEGSFEQKTRLLNLEEEILSETTTHFRLVGEMHYATNVAVFGGVEFTRAGGYPLEICLDNELILRFPLQVVQGDRAPKGHPTV